MNTNPKKTGYLVSLSAGIYTVHATPCATCRHRIIDEITGTDDGRYLCAREEARGLTTWFSPGCVIVCGGFAPGVAK